MENDNLEAAIAFLGRTPDLIQELTWNLERRQLIWKPSPKEFSVLENVCHLRDIEAEGYNIRIQKILTEETPVLSDIDGTRLAIAREYNSSDLTTALNEFRKARAGSLDILHGLSIEMLGRSGNLENVGLITLSELIGKMIEHDRSHLEELERLRENAPQESIEH